MSGLPREWHGGTLAPGTPAPSCFAGHLTCESCGTTSNVEHWNELGASYIEPAECPNCDTEWPDDSEVEPDEPDPDREYDTRFDDR